MFKVSHLPVFEFNYVKVTPILKVGWLPNLSHSADVHLNQSSSSTKDTYLLARNNPEQLFPFPYYNYTITSGSQQSRRKILLQDGLELTTLDRWASRCPRCFGPAQDEYKESITEPDVIICMDGNFQHRHNVLASKDNPTEDQYPSIFASPSQIAQHKCNTMTISSLMSPQDPCAQAHKTANDTRDSSTWDKCDDTGLFAAACRHDVTLALANIFQSGENLLDKILDEIPGRRFGILYDIGCHLDKHIKRVSTTFITFIIMPALN
ncbi:hypothetical protein DFH28DRAFT_903033 [Melampsora americana]|nr:hypothetical protein DFH28DRAFT_903033 [Melampsora americana]